MYDNAKVTITRPVKTRSQTTGYKTNASAASVISNVRCLYSESPRGRSVFANGIEQYTKPVPNIAIYVPITGVIQVGDQAVITPDATATATTYTVNAANKVKGLALSHWVVELEAVKTP